MPQARKDARARGGYLSRRRLLATGVNVVAFAGGLSGLLNPQRARAGIGGRARQAVRQEDTGLRTAATAPILEVGPAFTNPAISDAAGPGWAAAIVKRIPWPLAITPLPPRVGPRWAWTQILDPNDEFDRQAAGVSGTVTNTQQGSNHSDNPYLHPFGNDWECWIAIDRDRGFEKLLAPTNKGSFKPDKAAADYERGKDDYGLATLFAHRLAGDAVHNPTLTVPDEPAHAGVVGVEWDQGSIPPDFQAVAGDRIAVFGRLIVDAGHTDFHTEIHPPLLLAAARIAANTTQSTLVGRPYLVSQNFSVTPGSQQSDGATLTHLLKEIGKVLAFQSSRIEMHPIIPPKPFKGNHVLQYVVRPPGLPAGSTPPGPLTVRYRIVARRGVTVRMEQLDASTIGVTVMLNEQDYRPAALPPRRSLGIQPGDTDLGPTKAFIIQEGSAAAGAATLGVPVFGPILAGHAVAVLNDSWLADSYDGPQPPAAPLSSVIVAAADLARSPVRVLRDENQPWPVYGYVDVAWGTPRSRLTLGVRVAGPLLPFATPVTTRVVVTDRETGTPLDGTVTVQNFNARGRPAPFTVPTNTPFTTTFYTGRTTIRQCDLTLKPPRCFPETSREAPRGSVSVPGYLDTPVPFRFVPLGEEGQLVVSVEPAAGLPNGRPVRVTVRARDAGTGALVAGRVILDGQDVSATNAAFTTTFTGTPDGYVAAPGYSDTPIPWPPLQVSHLDVSVTPFPVPLKTRVSLTVVARDADTPGHALVTGTATIHTFDAQGNAVTLQLPTNRAVPVTLYARVTTTKECETRGRAQRCPTERIVTAPSATVSAPGYALTPLPLQ